MSIATPINETGPQPVELAENGRLRQVNLTDNERNFVVAMHLLPLLSMFIFPPLVLAPLFMWLTKKDGSLFIDDHGKELLNAVISYLLLSIIFVWTFVIPAILFVVAIISLIRATLAASNGEYFRYPMTIRFLS